MANKPWLPIALLVVIGGLFIYLNRDWFQPRPIQFSHRLYRFAGRFGGGDTATPMMFEFDCRLKLTSIKIVALADCLTNKYPHPLWQMISSSNSVPTKGFVYGMDVPGMRSGSERCDRRSARPPADLPAPAGSRLSESSARFHPRTDSTVTLPWGRAGCEGSQRDDAAHGYHDAQHGKRLDRHL